MNWNKIKAELKKLAADIRHQLAVYIPNLADQGNEIERIYALDEAARKRLAVLQEKLKAVQQLQSTRQQIVATQAEIARTLNPDTTDPRLKQASYVAKSRS